jgi:hypothetical protein
MTIVDRAAQLIAPSFDFADFAFLRDDAAAGASLAALPALDWRRSEGCFKLTRKPWSKSKKPSRNQAQCANSCSTAAESRRDELLEAPSGSHAQSP